MNIVHTERGITKISMAEHLHDDEGHIAEHGGERAKTGPAPRAYSFCRELALDKLLLLIKG